MCKFLKYSLKYLVLKDLSTISSLLFSHNRGKVWFLTFFIHICINYLNGFSIKNRVASTEATIGAKGISEVSFKVETQKIDIKKPLSLVEAFKRILANSLSPILTSRRFEDKWQ